MKPLVSILVPAYNAEESIAETLRSALGQTWQPIEIIVIDDGSTDRTSEILRQFESDGVRVIRQRNQGAAAARNKAFTLSRGDYIQWLDSDDLLAPDKIARQVEMLNQCQGNRTLFSAAFGRFMYRHRRAKFTPTSLWCDLSPVEFLLRKLGQNVYMQTSTWLVSRQLSEAAGPWDTSLSVDDDGEYFCRVLLASDGIRFVPEAKVYYRAPQGETLSRIGQSNRKVDAFWRSMNLHIRYLRSLEDSNRVRAACLTYLRTCLIYFYPERAQFVQQADQMATELGGQLGPPHLPWKYAWIQRAFGWNAAKRVQLWVPGVRWALERWWDKVLFRLENQKLATTAAGGSPSRDATASGCSR
jgi:glycosyltransferase involved in cell wall biosynthesis